MFNAKLPHKIGLHINTSVVCKQSATLRAAEKETPVLSTSRSGPQRDTQLELGCNLVQLLRNPSAEGKLTQAGYNLRIPKAPTEPLTFLHFFGSW